jgi:hypothetical protein
MLYVAPIQNQEVQMKRLSFPGIFFVLFSGSVFAGPTSGQLPGFAVDYPAVPIEKLADVILVLKPHATFSLQVPSREERIVQGDIVRVEKGVVPQTIVHTPSAIVAPLQAAVPVKLFLKSFKNRNAHYIIGVFPESYGGQP